MSEKKLTELSRADALDALQELQEEAAIASAPKIETLAEALDPSGLTFLTCGLVEKALRSVGDTDFERAIGVLWAGANSRTGEAIAYSAERIRIEAGKIAARIPLDEVNAYVARAELVIAKLPGRSGPLYAIEQVPEDLELETYQKKSGGLVLVDRGATVPATDGVRFRNDSPVRVGIRRILELQETDSGGEEGGEDTSGLSSP